LSIPEVEKVARFFFNWRELKSSTAQEDLRLRELAVLFREVREAPLLRAFGLPGAALRPDPDLFPPPVSLLTVAQALFSACVFGVPRFS
jgi:hypothetical protein